MNVFIPKEIAKGEFRVAASPETVKKLIAEKLNVNVETGAGLPSFFTDQAYQSQGATIVTDARTGYQTADLILKVQKPITLPSGGSHEIDLMKEGAALIGFLQPRFDKEMVKKCVARKLTSLSMDMIPRIARAQKLDALSSQSNVAGYKAVLMAANTLGKIMPLMMTAAGTIAPAKVLVIGAGVAGLQAIATAKRLGALIEAFDTRPVVKEQVESLGAKFISLDTEQETEDQGGYAKELSQESHDRELALIQEHTKHSDIVITTAQIPGKPSPVLITEETVKQMKPGSVIVDLAIEGGGNCALSVTDQVVTKHSVIIIGRSNVPSLMPEQASALYARNILNLVLEILDSENLKIDLENEVIKGSLVTQAGQIMQPELNASQIFTQGK
jgi:H+-translocating NAD(P) transhydrogenase subunit alpha